MSDMPVHSVPSNVCLKGIEIAICRSKRRCDDTDAADGAALYLKSNPINSAHILSKSKPSKEGR
jgi:hypothetical protein